MLFSVGVSADFYVDGSTLLLESGDVLVMNSGLLHNVVHGVERVHPHTTYRGTQLDLPGEMQHALQGTRATIQARQQTTKDDYRLGMAMLGFHKLGRRGGLFA